jgi:hypothetical protein
VAHHSGNSRGDVSISVKCRTTDQPLARCRENLPLTGSTKNSGAVQTDSDAGRHAVADLLIDSLNRTADQVGHRRPFDVLGMNQVHDFECSFGKLIGHREWAGRFGLVRIRSAKSRNATQNCRHRQTQEQAGRTRHYGSPTSQLPRRAIPARCYQQQPAKSTPGPAALPRNVGCH